MPTRSDDFEDDDDAGIDATSTIDRNALNRIIDAYHTAEPAVDERTNAMNSQELNRIITAHSNAANPALRAPTGQGFPRSPSSPMVSPLRSPSSPLIQRIPSSTNQPRLSLDDLDDEDFNGATSTINRSEINKLLEAGIPRAAFADDPLEEDEFNGATSTINRSEINRIIDEGLVSAPEEGDTPSAPPPRVDTAPEVPRYADDAHAFSDVTALPLAQVSAGQTGPKSATTASTASPAPSRSAGEGAAEASTQAPRAGAAAHHHLRKPLLLIGSASLLGGALGLSLRGDLTAATSLLAVASLLAATLGAFSALILQPQRQVILSFAALCAVTLVLGLLSLLHEISNPFNIVSLAGAGVGLAACLLPLSRELSARN
jgi:hypothetical protein